MIIYVSNSINTRVTAGCEVTRLATKLFCLFNYIYFNFFLNFINEYKTLINLNLSTLDIKIYFHISKNQVMC